MDTPISHDTKSYRALVDSGSQVTTTNHKLLLHGYKKISFHKYLQYAGKRITYNVEVKGYLFVPRGDGSCISIPCWYKPSMPVTVISLGEEVYTKKLMEITNYFLTSFLSIRRG